MNIVRLLSLASLSMIAMSNSCNKQTEVAPCDGTSAPVAMQVYAFPQTCSLTALPGQQKTYVINSLADLSAAMDCRSSVAIGIDFTRYTLLAGRAPMPAGASLRAQAVEEDCQQKYTYTVSISEGPTQSPTDVDYAVLVPKLPSNAIVDFIVVKVK